MADERDRLARTADLLVSYPWQVWMYGDTIGFEGLLRARSLLDDPYYEGWVVGALKSWAARARRFRPIGNTAPGHVMCTVVERSRTSPSIRRWRTSVCSRTTMDCSGTSGSSGPDGATGRDGDGDRDGLCSVLLDLLEYLPEEHPGRRPPEKAFLDLADALAATQTDTGGWWAVVHDPESGDESSTAALCAYGFARGAAAGPLPRSFYDRASAAFGYLLGHLREGGALEAVSAGVYASTAESHYRNVETGAVVPWGPGGTSRNSRRDATVMTFGVQKRDEEDVDDPCHSD